MNDDDDDDDYDDLLGLKRANMSKNPWRNAEVVWYTSPTEILGETRRGSSDLTWFVQIQTKKYKDADNWVLQLCFSSCSAVLQVVFRVWVFQHVAPKL